MKLRKYRWSRDYESAEEELIDFLRNRNIETERWHAEAGEMFNAHSHPKDKRLWCAEGSIILTVTDPETNTTKPISLQPGDSLELPAGTIHQAIAGISGVVCYESPKPSDNPASSTTD